MTKPKTNRNTSKSKRPSKRKTKPTPVEQVVKRGRGRPSSYKPEYAEQAYKLILLGATDEEMASFFGVSAQTLYTWRKQYPEFLEPTWAKVIADAEVAASSYKLATGYSYESERIIGKGDNARIVPIKVHVPGNPVAQQHWLRNRRRKDWGDTKQVEVGTPGEFDSMDVEELRRYIALEDQMLGLYDAEPGSESIN